MSYSDKLTALHKGLTPIYADQDRINFAPQLREDIRLLTNQVDDAGNPIYFNFNKVYTASDEHFPELAGTIWVISNLDGWYTTSDLELPNIERGYADGNFDVDGRFLARDIEISGSVIIETGNRSDTRTTNPTTELLTTVTSAGIGTLNFLARKRLLELFNLVRRGSWLIVDEDSLVSIEYEDYAHVDNTLVNLNHRRSCFVRLSSRPELETVDSKGRIDFSITLRANDPVKYEWVEADNIIPGDSFTANGYNSSSLVATVPTTEFRLFDSTVPNWEVADASTDDTNVVGYTTVGVDESDYVEGYSVYSGDVGISTQQQDNGIVALNHGNTSVYCILRVYGPVYGPAEITNVTTGQTVTILASDTVGIPIIDSAQYLEIDTRIRSVKLFDIISNEAYSGSYRSFLEPLLDWIYLQPGENDFIYTDFGSQGVSSTLEVYWRSGWIG